MDSAQTKDKCIGLFVKHPQSGNVKTRLADQIGLEKAAELYRHFVFDILYVLKNTKFEMKIFYDPANPLADYQNWLGDSLTYLPQKGNDLGQRMKNALSTIFNEGCSKALIIGSDSPDLPVEYLDLGLYALNQFDSVLGPSGDGGYYTIGFTAKGMCPEAFDNINWGTITVFQETISILRRKEKKFLLLPLWFDVDTLNDLHDLAKRNMNTPFSKLQTVRYMKEKKLWSLTDV